MEPIREFEHNVLGLIDQEKMDTLMAHAILKHFYQQGLISKATLNGIQKDCKKKLGEKSYLCL